MINNSSEQLGAAGTPLTRKERDEILERYRDISRRLIEGIKAKPPISTHVEVDLQAERRLVKQEYFARLPRTALSRCPFCDELFRHSFDPWGLDGFWWQHGEWSVKFDEPRPCEHFAVMLGAVNLNGLPAAGGSSQALVGPEVPYVIPRILNLASMIAVISSFQLGCGYTAFPIVYFSQIKPPIGSLTQSWTKNQYDYRNAKGMGVWTIKTDPWDFDLLPWLNQGKIQWVDIGDAKFELRSKPASAFPYHNLPGRREPIVVKNKKLWANPLPKGETVNPFSE